MVELKVCGWGASARGSGERSEPAAGRPRKEQAPKAPSRIASIIIFLSLSKPLHQEIRVLVPMYAYHGGDHLHQLQSSAE